MNCIKDYISITSVFDAALGGLTVDMFNFMLNNQNHQNIANAVNCIAAKDPALARVLGDVPDSK